MRRSSLHSRPRPPFRSLVTTSPSRRRGYLPERSPTSSSRIRSTGASGGFRKAGSPISPMSLRRTSSTISSRRSCATASPRAAASVTTARPTPSPAPRWPCSSCARSTARPMRLRPRREASSRTSPRMRSRQPGSRRWPRKASPAAAAEGTTARSIPSGATRWPSSCSRPSTGRATCRRSATAASPMCPVPRISPTGSSSSPQKASPRVAAAETTVR